ncbi:unnamed protein product [Triticum turgidum subsp. durum]|uniref:F-box protein AT5G49610-like beta-propeller domain-containing protein n=1 Tax=Triticum turgidum subsp. durum TaxID=4567 RepID=A0A9R1S8R9_TRITD|nr:unnamed protein product [Triticum turgidum subsp. durum]
MEGEAQSPLGLGGTGGDAQPPLGLDGTEGDAQLPSACVSKVLDDDNLLTEIIVRVGFPTSLVRAAGVCRRWLSHASDRAFLRCFRELHPPTLLGFYIKGLHKGATRFVPMLPQPPELAAVVRRADFRLDTYDSDTNQMLMAVCRNGSVVTSWHKVKSPRDEIAFTVQYPLCYGRDMTILPGLSLTIEEFGYSTTWTRLFSKEEGDGLSIFFLVVEIIRKPVHVYTLQNGDGAWRKHLTLADCDLHPGLGCRAVLSGNKIYAVSSMKDIVVVDLKASISSTIPAPHGVDFELLDTVMLPRADDGSGVYLIHIKELQLHIWLHNGDNWLLVDTICLTEICADLLEDDSSVDFTIIHVGDYNEFVFLEMDQCILYLDIKRRTLRRVSREYDLFEIYPFMMSWPPIFPVLMDSPSRDAT